MFYDKFSRIKDRAVTDLKDRVDNENIMTLSRAQSADYNGKHEKDTNKNYLMYLKRIYIELN